jgi:(p)ppGpp synthase/HD superfamily hydrolase
MTTADLYLPSWRDVVEVVPKSFIARPGAEHSALAQFSFGPVRTAFQVATIAHAAIGQRRAAVDAPYIVHPLHVGALAYRWSFTAEPPERSRIGADRVSLLVVAMLHDVVEDTRLTGYDLTALGVDSDDAGAVQTLTKDEPHAYEGAPYFEACAPRYVTWLVKAADRCSNLLSAAEAAIPGERNQRWKNYVERTRTEMLPVYERLWPEGVTIAGRDYVLAALHEATRRAETASCA